MDKQQVLQRLRSITAFSEMATADLEQLRQDCQDRSVRAGEWVFHEGELGEELFLVLTGEVKVFVTQRTLGIEKELRRLGPGDYFGEVSLLTGGTRTASVRAIHDTRLLALTRSAFVALLGRLPSLAMSVCSGLARYIEANRTGTGTTLPYVRLRDFPDFAAHANLLPAAVARATRAMVVARAGEHVTVAMVNPHDGGARNFLQQVLAPRPVDFAAWSEEDFLTAASALDASDDAAGDASQPGTAATGYRFPLQYLGADGASVELGGNAAGELLLSILQRAIAYGASDIHLEPRRQRWQVRLRLDGRMIHLEPNVPPDLARPLLGRLKVMAGLDITEHRTPQDGGFGLTAAGRAIDARLSLIPTEHGEKAVVRLLDAASQPDDLAALIPARPVEHAVRELFLQPAGLVLVTGPTGSGKTTTLYAGLHAIGQADGTLNIVTVEDPIDRRLDHATQVPVNLATGVDFPRVLRALLRQDPDVILVGEIRDRASAALTLEAATTGHTVFSSLHTDRALEALTRLRELGVEPYQVAAALRGVITQQLLPRVCQACSEPAPDDAGNDQVRRLLLLGVLPSEASAAGRLTRGRGCPVCRQTGVKGRVALFEVLAVDRPMGRLLERGAGVAEIETALHEGNWISRERYGRFLLLEGWVSPTALCQALGEPPQIDAGKW